MADPDELEGIPPAPRIRTITPAPEDYAGSPALVALLWPLLFFGVAALLVQRLWAAGWPT